MRSNAQNSSSTLGWGILFGTLLSLWSANSGAKFLFKGINIAYDEENTRGFLKLNGITLLFTLAGILLGSVCFVVVLAFPAQIEIFGLPSWLETVLQISR